MSDMHGMKRTWDHMELHDTEDTTEAMGRTNRSIEKQNVCG